MNNPYLDPKQTTNTTSVISKTPTTVFSGFLGSGKTTIIMNLIDELQNKEQVIYIKNEIGQEDIDGTIIRGKNIKTKELLNGCICCTLVGPFVSSINEVIDSFKPDRIIIEASGAADPSAIALMIDGHPKLSRDGVISIIDVANFEGYKDLSFTARNQTKFTDLIIFNKIELVDLAQKKAVVGYVRELNTVAPIVEAPNGKIHPEVVFGVAQPDLINALFNETKEDHEAHHTHLNQDGISSLAFSMKKLSDEELQNFFANQELFPLNVFRVKAIATSKSGKSWFINRVGSRLTIEESKNSFPQSRLVCIGFHLEQNKDELKSRLLPILD